MAAENRRREHARAVLSSSTRPEGDPVTRTKRAPRLRDPNEDRAPRGRRDGRCIAQCWCQRGLVPVEPAVLRACRTETCGRAWCAGPMGVG